MSKKEDAERRFAQIEGERDYYKRIAEMRGKERDELGRLNADNVAALFRVEGQRDKLREALIDIITISDRDHRAWDRGKAALKECK